MQHVTEPAELDAVARKRDRDKRNQRNKRHRERQYVVSLETRIGHLEQLLKASGSREADIDLHTEETPVPGGSSVDLSDAERRPTIVEQRTAPSAQQPHWRDVVGALTTFDGDSRQNRSDTMLITASAIANVSHDIPTPTESLAPSSSYAPLGSPIGAISRAKPVLEVTEELFCRLLDAPEWSRLPMSNLDAHGHRPHEVQYRMCLGVAELRSQPELQAACTAVPRPIDLLYGSSKNPLSNCIFATVSSLPLLPPEKFASSWLIYLYLRWLIWPSEESFHNIPDFFRPTPLQLTKMHDLSCDLILWPAMRTDLIRHGADFNFVELTGLLTCTFRIRGCFNREFIYRETEGDLQVKPDFYQQFMRLESWGILERFWTKYPELVRHLDRSFMLKEENLIPPP